MKNKHKIVYLETSSWVGTVAIGAIHTYGKMVHSFGERRKSVDVERPMTAAEAKAENKKHRAKGFIGNLYKPGSTTTGLRNEKDVIETALATWKDHFPYALILVLGESSWYEPKRILESPNECKQLELNLMYVDYEQGVGEEWDQEELDEITDAWERTFEEWLEALPEVECWPEPEDDHERWITEHVEKRKQERRERQAREDAALEAAERRRAEREVERQEWLETAEFDEVKFTVKARTTIAKDKDGNKRGFLTFFMAVADVQDNNGNNIGSVKSGTDASVWLCANEFSDELYQIKVDDLWYAFREALERKNNG